MQPDALSRAQIAFVVAEFAADIGDDEPETGREFDQALAELCESPVQGPGDAASRLRFLVCVARRYSSCESIGAEIRVAMSSIADWLAQLLVQEKGPAVALCRCGPTLADVDIL